MNDAAEAYVTPDLLARLIKIQISDCRGQQDTLKVSTQRFLKIR